MADLNGDGRDDIIAGGQPNDGSETVEDRLDKPPVQVFLGTRDGRLRLASAEMLPSIRARTPVAVTDDFNGDGRLDLAVFDAGVYVWAESSGYGNLPQLLLSTPSGGFEHSAALADAVREEHEQRPTLVPSPTNPADLHIKSATSGDIDNDGDADLWVQSGGGGANVEEHFMVNNGDGTFTVDRDNRATRPVLHAQPPDGSRYWGWDGGHFVDDVDPDALAWTGRYIQVLVNRRVPLPGGGIWFGNETETWVKGQEIHHPGAPAERQAVAQRRRPLRETRCRPGRMYRPRHGAVRARREPLRAARLPQQRERPVSTDVPGSVPARGQVLR